MAWKLTAAPYCLLFLALAVHIEAAPPHSSMLDLDEESTMAKLRFEAGDPACGRFQFRYECFDVPPSSYTPSTHEPAAFVEDAQVLPEDPSDCGPLGKHKYRCVPPMNTPAPEEVSPVGPSVQQAYQPARSDCGPLSKHKYRCVPPMH